MFSIKGRISLISLVYEKIILWISSEGIIALVVSEGVSFQNDDVMIAPRKDCKENEVKGDDYKKNKEKGVVGVYQVNYVKKIQKMIFGFINDKDSVKG